MGAVRGEGRGGLVVGGVGQPPQTGAVHADDPQLALDRAVRAPFSGVERHGPSVGGEFGVRGVPVAGELAYRPVRLAHVHLRADAVAQAGEDHHIAAYEGVLVVVGRPVPEQRVGAGRTGDPADAAVLGPGVGDAPGVDRGLVRRGGQPWRTLRAEAEPATSSGANSITAPTSRPSLVCRAGPAVPVTAHLTVLLMTLQDKHHACEGGGDRSVVPGPGETAVALCGAHPATLPGRSGREHRRAPAP